MPSLSNIVGLINTALQANPFTGNKYQHAKWNALADSQLDSDGNTVRPVIIAINGEESDLSINDKYNLQIYHWLTTLNYRIDDTPTGGGDYGNPGTVMKEEAQVEIIFYGDRSNVSYRPEDLVAAAMLWIPKEFTPAQCSANNLASCTVDVGQVELDSYKVWVKQYAKVQYKLKPSQFMVSISYRIISTFNKTCYTIC